jgi:HD-like signal output (HDOD) protein
MAKNFEINEIPAIQDVVLKVVHYELDNEISGSNDLLSLCSRILQVANSAYYTVVGKAETLQAAINRLGLRTIKMLVMSAANSNIKAILRKGIYEKYIYEYPLVTAFNAIELCKILKRTDFHKDDIYFAGLLFKIGMTVIALNAKKEYAALIELAEKKKMGLIKAEEAEFGTNHVIVGKMIAEKWNMGDTLIEVIANTITDPAMAAGYPDRVRIINLADIIARELTGCLVLDEDLAVKKSIAASFGLETSALEVFNQHYLEGIREQPIYSF